MQSQHLRLHISIQYFASKKIQQNEKKITAKEHKSTVLNGREGWRFENME
jgi:hypothetical protein